MKRSKITLALGAVKAFLLAVIAATFVRNFVGPWLFLNSDNVFSSGAQGVLDQIDMASGVTWIVVFVVTMIFAWRKSRIEHEEVA